MNKNMIHIWSGGKNPLDIEHLYRPAGIDSVFRVYFRGMLTDIVAHPRVDFTPQAMRELLLDEGYRKEIIVIKCTGILRG